MNISVFGIGYVGCISLGCLANNGHKVIGVDVNQEKVDLINQGKPTVVEKDIDGIIKNNFNNKKIIATKNDEKAILNTSVSIICVGTPSSETGHLNLDYIYKVASQLGEVLAQKETFHTILLRSTVPPGTNGKVCQIIESASGKRKNIDFAVVSNPEFLREGTAVYDFYNPPYTVLASESKKGLEIAGEIYKNINSPIIEMNVKEAEILKYVSNSFHALKICFANEIGNICKKLGVDSHRLMDVFCRDTKLNISSYYLKPGFAYGGSCLPKDLLALITLAHDFYLDSPVLTSIDKSNKNQIAIVLDVVIKLGKKKIGFLGLSFKPGTDDLRYSPILEVIERLLGKGYEIKIYDKNVHLSNLIGANKGYIESKLPHIQGILIHDIYQVISESEVIIIANREKGIENLQIGIDKIIIDLTRINEFVRNDNYLGICW